MIRSALVLSLLLLIAACQGQGADTDTPVGPTADPIALAPRLAATYDEGLASLDNFRVFALGTSLYYIAVGDSTNRTFQLVRDPEAGMPNDLNAGNLFAFFPPNPRYLADNLGNMAPGETVERDGVRTLVFESTNPLHMGFRPVEGTINHFARVYLDAETLDVRELYHRFEVDTLAQPLAQRVLYDEYREIADGVRIPFRVRQIQEGNLQLITEEARMIRGADIALREQQAQALPPARRDSALRLIAREKRFFTEGINEIILAIDSVQVNVPLPDTLSGPGMLQNQNQSRFERVE